MKTHASLYDYRLPKEMIAQSPAVPRDSSRLLVADRSAGTLAHRRFSDITEYLREGDLLVVNNTRVFPARLFFVKETGARIEFLFMHPAGPAARDGRTAYVGALQFADNTWVALARPGKRLKEGAELALEKKPDVRITVEGKNAEEGTCRVRFQPEAAPREIFERYGEVPLPPYIEKPLEDEERYQTVYSSSNGSTAAPTAGLHFTPRLMEKIKARGCRFAYVTLHIGYATFRPIRAEFVEDHPMHAEWYEVPDETAAEIVRAKNSGGRVVAVGTTSVRALESWAKNENSGNGSAWTSLYITEGFPFRAVDALVTNFHLPKSTLLVLTSAFCGRDLLMRAYEEAMAHSYRFYSLGDAMLIL